MLKIIVLIALLFNVWAVSAQTKNIVVNNKHLDQQTIKLIETYYKTSLKKGHYWYDKLSGYWGIMGSEAKGKIIAGLVLGGDLPADASNGHSGVFINGRELNQKETNAIKDIYGTVYKSRFWLNDQGLAGYEGQAAIFNFSKFQNKSFVSRSLFGSSGSDGKCYYYSHPGGSSVSNCD